MTLGAESEHGPTKRRHRPHWYRIYYGWCPVCMREKGYRERVYGRKPKDAKKRYVALGDHETYDWCEL